MPKVPRDKISLSIRLTPEARQLLKVVAKELGMKQSDMMELAIREFVHKHRGAASVTPSKDKQDTREQ